MKITKGQLKKLIKESVSGFQQIDAAKSALTEAMLSHWHEWYTPLGGDVDDGTDDEWHNNCENLIYDLNMELEALIDKYNEKVRSSFNR